MNMFTSGKATLTSWKKKHITWREGRHEAISQRIFLVISIYDHGDDDDDDDDDDDEDDEDDEDDDNDDDDDNDHEDNDVIFIDYDEDDVVGDD